MTPVLVLIGAITAGAAAPAYAADVTEDAATVARALDARALQLEMRGQRVGVEAAARPAENGCATRIVASAPASPRRWARLLRWSELAWSGMAADGSTQVVFYDAEGHLATDLVAFTPDDPASFRDALARLVPNCRAARGEAARVIVSESGRTRSCYLAAHPEAQIIAARPGESTASPPRLSLTLLAKESPRVELQMLFEQPADGEADDAGPEPFVDLIVAEPSLVVAAIGKAAFELDGREFAVRHSIAAYGTTRLRIAIGAGRTDPSGFRSALPSAREAAITLLGADGTALETFHFAPVAALDPVMSRLSTDGWSCADTSPAMPPAARWQAAR